MSVVTRIRFTTTGVPAGKCKIDYRFDTDPVNQWSPFGDPVPTFVGGHMDGFEVHDLYHLTLYAETGWSAVLSILLHGDRDGVFGGPGALGEEGVVMDWHMGPLVRNSDDKATALLNAVGANAAVDAVRRARERGEKGTRGALATLRKTGSATTVISMPDAFVTKAIAYRQAKAQIDLRLSQTNRAPAAVVRQSRG